MGSVGWTPFDDLLMNATIQTDADPAPLFLRHRILIVGCMMVDQLLRLT